MTRHEGLSPTESRYYDLGRQAHAAGFKTEACNVVNAAKRSWWLGGWHDADIEAGNRVLTGKM